MLAYIEMVCKIEEQMIAGHNAACEEIFSHPVTIITNLERIGEFTVCKDMDEQTSFRF